MKRLFIMVVASFAFLSMESCFFSNITYADTPPPPITYLENTIPSGKMSFYFQDIEIRTLLQLIAKHSGLNFIISDAVKGNVTLNLKDVTWRQALDIVMSAHGLTARRVGNVMYVSTIDDITNYESKKLQSDQQLSNLAPLVSTIVQLKYANAKDLADFLKGPGGSLLTPRGQVAIDPRTNSIIIRDTQINLAELIRTIRHLDVPAKQVLIEARIVTIDTSYEEQLGIKFGLSGAHNHTTGTFDAANAVQQGTALSNISPPESRLNFNNPASQLASGAVPGSIGLALARIGAFFLDLELSAIEEEGHGQVIASPHVITSNQEKARIETGEDIPYQEATSSGATSISFKKAVLSLEITPQITPNNKIILRLKATEDSRGPQLIVSAGTSGGAATSASGTATTTAATPPVLGPPVINSQEVESNVLLNNNETIVIGGVYKQTKTSTVDRIPFFGSLPIIGYLFRHTSTSNQRKELLIFITPKIINNFSTAGFENRRYGQYKGEV
jgi:type IV pilus assembly protein PilQ